jgi:hypothetical protein
MGYFDKFPNLYYDVKRDKNYQFVVDILRRVRINSKAVEGSLYGEYTLKDTDRPDTIAHKLYGDSNLHWVILLFNEIHNPYYEWPMPYHEFLRYCEDKYPGKAFLLEMDAVKQSPIPSVRKRKDHKVTEGYYAFGVTGNTLNLNRRGYVVCWDRTMNKAIVIEEQGSFQPGDSIAFALTGSSEATASGTVRRIQLNTEAVHHFEDDNSNPLAPLASYGLLVQQGAEPQTTNTLDDYGRYATLPFAQTLLGAYLTNEEEAQIIRAVTNSEYETRLNESRRQIRLPSPDIVREIADKFEQILNEEF